MFKYAGYDVVCQEFPDEITLAFNLTRCPNNCPNCHSAYLAQDMGEELTEEVLNSLLSHYDETITCVALMGGDNDPLEVSQRLGFVKRIAPSLRTGWYSGREVLPTDFNIEVLDYLKLGAYVEALGPLSSLTTNQRFYRVEQGVLTDLTHRFQAKLQTEPE